MTDIKDTVEYQTNQYRWNSIKKIVINTTKTITIGVVIIASSFFIFYDKDLIFIDKRTKCLKTVFEETRKNGKPCDLKEAHNACIKHNS